MQRDTLLFETNSAPLRLLEYSAQRSRKKIEENVNKNTVYCELKWRKLIEREKNPLNDVVHSF